jgi:hypothetical protein
MGKIKKLFINHGEKIGMALFGLIVLVGLAGADWVPYSGTPNQITSKVQANEQAWLKPDRAWTPEEAAQFELKPEDDPKAIVDRELAKAMPLSDFNLTQKFVRSPYEQVQPLKNPEFQQLQDPIANGGRVLLAVNDEKYIKEMELFQQGLDKDGKPLPEGTFPGAPKPVDDNTPDEFRKRPGAGLGAAGSLLPGADAGLNNYDPSAIMPGGRGRRGPGGAAAADAGLSTYDPANPDAAMGMGMMAAAGLPPGQTGRGFRYISIRAVFPIRDQIHKIAEATNLQPQQAAMALEILDYQLERQTMQESGDPWGGPWEPVDVNVATDVLTKMAVGLEPDIVYSQVTDPAMTMPLPSRVTGQWHKDATHPRIEKFTLTEQQIKQEVMFQQESLRKLEELKKELPDPPAFKKGWTGMVISGNQLNSAMMGGDMMGGGYGGGGYGGAFAMPESGAGMEGSGSYGGGGMMPGGFGGQTAAGGPRGNRPPAKISPIDDLIKKTDKDRKKEIEEYVKNVVSVVGELLLFRYIDFSVEPGKTYRYRARLVFRNPNFGKDADAAAGDTSVVTGETRTSDWSEPTKPEPVQKDQQTYVTDVRSGPGFAFPAPMLNVFQWDATLGSLQQSVLDVRLGQTISGKKRTSVLDPAKASFEEKDYQFQSTDVVVDAQADVQLEPSAHPDVKPAGGTGGLMLPEQVLVSLSEGGMSLLDPSVQKTDESKWKGYHEKQNEDWKKMKEQSTMATDPLLGAAGTAGGEAGMMMDMYAGYGGRGLNPLQSKKSKGRSRGRQMPAMP